MTVRDLGRRLGIASSSVTRLEQREREGAITLAALRKAAAALDCELVYAVVPRSARLDHADTDNLLDAMIIELGREIAIKVAAREEQIWICQYAQSLRIFHGIKRLIT